MQKAAQLSKTTFAKQYSCKPIMIFLTNLFSKLPKKNFKKCAWHHENTWINFYSDSSREKLRIDRHTWKHKKV